ncbi:hypothetical protein [Streptomyces decoyicus]
MGDIFPSPAPPINRSWEPSAPGPCPTVEAQLAGRTLTQGSFLLAVIMRAILGTEAGDVPLNLATSHKRAAPLLVWMLGGLFASSAKNPEPGVRVGGGPAV